MKIATLSLAGLMAAMSGCLLEDPAEMSEPFGTEAVAEDDDLLGDDLAVDLRPASSISAVAESDDQPSTDPSLAACIFPTFRRYPGSSNGSLRYGQADIRFEICSGQHPSSWKASISAWHNTTASVQGFDFVDEEVHATSGGDYYRFYTATFKLKDCLPYYAWPCSIKGTFRLNFYAWDVEGTPGVVLQSATAFTGWRLFTTP